jgi:hypothetical protein
MELERKSKNIFQSVWNEKGMAYICAMKVKSPSILFVTGCYAIVCTQNGMTYIGSTVYLNIRRINHFSELRLGKHANTKMQRDFDKFGESSFRFKVLCYCFASELLLIEKSFIDAENPDTLYNQKKPLFRSKKSWYDYRIERGTCLADGTGNYK